MSKYSEDEDIMVTLDLDDGSTLNCDIGTIFDLDGQSYIVLIPLDENEEPIEDADVIIYRYFEDENGEATLDNIDDDEEMEAVMDRFDEILDEQLFDEMD